jgi:hypothetical protein
MPVNTRNSLTALAASGEYLPLRQLLHALDPLAAEIVPMEHAWHAVDLAISLKYPALHSRHPELLLKAL